MTGFYEPTASGLNPWHTVEVQKPWPVQKIADTTYQHKPTKKKTRILMKRPESNLRVKFETKDHD